MSNQIFVKQLGLHNGTKATAEYRIKNSEFRGNEFYQFFINRWSNATPYFDIQHSVFDIRYSFFPFNQSLKHKSPGLITPISPRSNKTGFEITEDSGCGLLPRDLPGLVLFYGGMGKSRG